MLLKNTHSQSFGYITRFGKADPSGWQIQASRLWAGSWSLELFNRVKHKNFKSLFLEEILIYLLQLRCILSAHFESDTHLGVGL